MSDDKVRELIDATAALVGSCSGAGRDETILGENVRRARDAVAAFDTEAVKSDG